jgi:hypothetical protein
MWFNSFLEQRLREERVKDALRKAEQARLIQVAKGAGVNDQPVLHCLLIKIRDLGLSLLPINRIEPALDRLIRQLN